MQSRMDELFAVQDSSDLKKNLEGLLESVKHIEETYPKIEFYYQHTDYDYGEDAELYVYAYRFETDAEYKKRLDKQKKAEAAKKLAKEKKQLAKEQEKSLKEINERATLARLLQKYPDAS